MAINDRFDKPGFKIYQTMEEFLLKAIKGEDYSLGLSILEEDYANDTNFFNLSAKLPIFRNQLRGKCVKHFDDIYSEIKLLNAPSKLLIEVKW